MIPSLQNKFLTVFVCARIEKHDEYEIGIIRSKMIYTRIVVRQCTLFFLFACPITLLIIVNCSVEKQNFKVSV